MYQRQVFARTLSVVEAPYLKQLMPAGARRVV